jgi:hypothetical protein
MSPAVLEPADPALPGLSAALDPAVMSAQFAAVLGGDAPERVVAVDVLKHRPGRRCALAYRLEGARGERRLFAKLFHSNRGASIFADMRLVAAALDGGPVVVPRPIAYVAPLRLLVTEFVEGAALAPALYAGEGREPARRMGRALAALHASGVTLARTWTTRDEIENTRRLLGPGAAAGRAAELLATLERGMHDVSEANAAPIHRDFYPDQLLDCGGRTALLDLDDASSGDPALDLGNCLAHLILRPLQFPATAPGCRIARRDFLEAYVAACRPRPDEEPLRRRVRYFEATSLLRLSGVYAARPRWAETLPPALLDACERGLESRRPDDETI